MFAAHAIDQTAGHQHVDQGRVGDGEHGDEAEDPDRKIGGPGGHDLEQRRLAFAQLLRVLLPTAVAALPILALLYWLDMTYGYRFPAGGEAAAARADPPTAEAELVRGAGEAEWSLAVAVVDGARFELPLPKPVPVIYERQWWNAIIGNPAGYLPMLTFFGVLSSLGFMFAWMLRARERGPASHGLERPAASL